MTRFLYDTAVFVYAVGGTHPYRGACREIVRRASKDELHGEASVDLLQEFLHQRTRRTGDREGAVHDAWDVAGLCRLHDLERGDVELALDLFAQHPRLGARDASFAAVALNRGIGHVLSPDRAFEDVQRLTRVDPLDAHAVAALA